MLKRGKLTVVLLFFVPVFLVVITVFYFVPLFAMGFGEKMNLGIQLILFLRAIPFDADNVCLLTFNAFFWTSCLIVIAIFTVYRLIFSE